MARFLVPPEVLEVKGKTIFLPSSLSTLPAPVPSPWHSTSKASHSLEEKLSWASPLNSIDSVFNLANFAQPQGITHE